MDMEWEFEEEKPKGGEMVKAGHFMWMIRQVVREELGRMMKNHVIIMPMKDAPSWWPKQKESQEDLLKRLNQKFSETHVPFPPTIVGKGDD